jgi:hypothetical protein
MTIEIKEVLDMIELVSMDYADNVLAQEVLDDVRKLVEAKLNENDEGMEKIYGKI